MSKNYITSDQIRKGQLIEAVFHKVYENSPETEYFSSETNVRRGRVKFYDSQTSIVTLDNGSIFGVRLSTREKDFKIILLEDVPHYNMVAGYYRYWHSKSGTQAVVHYDGQGGFGHTDQAQHKGDKEYFGYDPLVAETLFERIVQS